MNVYSYPPVYIDPPTPLLCVCVSVCLLLCSLTFCQTIACFYNPETNAFCEHCVKGRKECQPFSPFPYNVGKSAGNKFQFLRNVYLVVYRCFQFGSVYNFLSLGLQRFQLYSLLFCYLFNPLPHNPYFCRP